MALARKGRPKRVENPANRLTDEEIDDFLFRLTNEREDMIWDVFCFLSPFAGVPVERRLRPEPVGGSLGQRVDVTYWSVAPVRSEQRANPRPDKGQETSIRADTAAGGQPELTDADMQAAIDEENEFYGEGWLNWVPGESS